ncbi:carbon-nitrogen hydrolase family protein [Lacrimispora sp. 210928-DFI.3.58]|uniref:carbon-nitrogen hydrolase family protein n=1 Tax=Lacrimispora sp. 210928-DFI.3.58 TaxID=2883214 RepID=UPI001D06FF88|nr:carbon-nitrogen hydrolase family protein [Lacrimispora sp. 210928-DFI.3.58]MCB7317819.1 carbon-nitrogen hydrolase family protein [Lacrimispora sp. 210928-DFI.3.58]
MRKLRLALVQMEVVPGVERNLETARKGVKKAAEQGAELVVLPEMFCCLYQNSEFVRRKEPKGGQIWQALKEMAADNSVYLVGGSMPEEEGGKIYNTSFIFDPEGLQIGRHRKVHLFDIDVPGGQQFFESRVFSPGNDVTVVDTAFGKVGVCLCFDIRFPELSRIMALQGAEAIIIPAAFNMTTGPAHWELHFRGRAVDNQLFMAGCAPARDVNGPYVSYGNSIVTDPWGRILGRLDEKPGILVQEIDLDAIKAVREQLPLIKNRRKDLYHIGLSGI